MRPATYSEEILKIADQLAFEPSAVAESRALAPERLHALTNAYVREVHQSPSYWRLMPAKDLAVPFLIAVLERPDAFEPIAESEVLKETPGSRALAFLTPGEHEPLKRVLRKWLQTGDPGILKQIAFHLTAFGTEDLLPDVKVLFEHDDMFIASGARAGALEAITRGRAQSRFKQYVWDHSVGLLGVERPPSMHDPIRLLVALDPEKTKRILLKPEVMREDHPLLAEAISTLNELRAPPPADFLIRLIGVRGTVPDHRRDRIRQAALYGLIIHQHPKASEFVEEILADPSQFKEDMVLSAWTARFRIRGLTPTHDSAVAAYEQARYSMDGLSQDLRDLILIHYLDAEVCNGGFWQWYYNDFGRYGIETQKALERIGAAKHAKVVAAANRLFGLRGPPKEREKVQEKLEAMSEAKAEQMSALDDRWFALPSWELHAAEWDWNRQIRNDD